uniref:RING-type domain-containing protein n=2 Tax=Cucumis sativus TaxID=3659 RepID=A0A0A0KMY7_CUCSA
MSLLSVILQEAARREREARTIWGFLTDQMDGIDGGGRRRPSLKQRLGFKVMGCCGATWGFRPPSDSVRDGGGEDDDRRVPDLEVMNTRREERELNRSCLSPLSVQSPGPSGMNLATALAAERRLRASPRGAEGDIVEFNNNDFDSAVGMMETGTPLRVSLLRLLEETDGGCDDGGGGNLGVAEKKRDETRNDSMCCVCMGRKKGAAFIPCGHTFCRICSRELWLNRGSCPLCNRPIIEILDIF